jgi:hypothetical protein
MTRHTFVLIWLILLALVLAGCGSTNSSSASPTTSTLTCTFNQFQATVHQGPDRGLSMQDQLILQANQAGSLTGMLKQTSEADVAVTGQANGRAINLIFDLGENRLLFGVGTLQPADPTLTSFLLRACHRFVDLRE